MLNFNLYKWAPVRASCLFLSFFFIFFMTVGHSNAGRLDSRPAPIAGSTFLPDDPWVNNPYKKPGFGNPPVLSSVDLGKLGTCSKKSPCASPPGGNKCYQVFCDEEKGQCLINPATVQYCPIVDDTTCAKNVCNPTTGACQMTKFQDAHKCSDDDLFTDQDMCQQGVCVGKKVPVECTKNSDCDKKMKNKCEPMVCVLSLNPALQQCKPATPIKCETDSDFICRVKKCDETSGQCVVTTGNEGMQCYAPKSTLPKGVLMTDPGKCSNGMCIGNYQYIKNP